MPRTTEGSAKQQSTVARGAPTERGVSTAPVKLHRPDVSLSDKYLLEQGIATQAELDQIAKEVAEDVQVASVVALASPQPATDRASAMAAADCRSDALGR